MNIYLQKNVGWYTEQDKSRQVFRNLRGDMINVGIDYYDNIESKKTSDVIFVVIPEEEKKINTTTKSIIQRGSEDREWEEYIQLYPSTIGLF